MADWNALYRAVAGASATLIGLIFVGVSISLTKILSIRGLPDRALLSLVLLLNILVLSVLFLVPQQSVKNLGKEVLIIGIVVWCVVLRLDLRAFQNKQKQYKWRYAFNMLVDQTATLLYMTAGVALATNNAKGMYWMVAAILISIVKAVLDAWVLLVEINR